MYFSDELNAQFRDASRISKELFDSGNLVGAENHLREELDLALTLQPDPQDLNSTLQLSLRRVDLSVWLVQVLLKLGAKPECEPVLHIAIENLRTSRRLSDESSVSALDDHLVWALQKLGEIYVQGPELYVDSRAQLKPIASIEEMRDYRHQLMASGTWGGETLSFVSEDWWAKAEAPIFEAISLWGSLEAHYSEKEFKSRLGDLFRYLGFSYMKTGRDDEAVDALQEAEEMYLDIYDFDPARFQPLVMDTRISLVELSGRTVMLEGDGGKQNRITALENSLPFLREDAYITEYDRENGITMAKSSARDRLTNALRELASEYKTIGMHDKAESLWNGELGELITESLPIRYG